jgi:hypothetical protein
MRIFCLLIVSLYATTAFCSPKNYIEIDLVSKEVKFADFSFGNLKVQGNLSYKVNKERGLFTLDLDGKNIILNEKNFPWIKR